ncbi:MAG: Ca-activated chloride channel family protein [Bradymonadia bacterium]|jgi:Ca-activated chloride channel family protein
MRLFALTLALVSMTGLAQAKQVKLDMRLGSPVLQANQKHKAWLKVGMTGFERESASDRVPINVAIVLDKSGSMSGQKIQKAREAAIMAVQRLDPNDIVSVVTYDNTVRVVVPATKAADKKLIIDAIRRVAPGGNTALFAGVSKGADELRKFLDRNRVNRLVLLSDGLANVGPSAPGDLQNLGAGLSRQGMTVTTLGLGSDYNEDLMQSLASASDGNHLFIERPQDLKKSFDLEFGDVMAVVAQDVDVQIVCADGIRPIRVLGRDADIVGQKISARINQLISNHEKSILLEIELPPGETGGDRPVCEATVRYRNLETQNTDTLSASTRVRFVATAAEAESNFDRDVMVRAVQLVSNETNRKAVVARDQGDLDKARRMLQDNATWLNSNSARYNAPSLKKLEKSNISDAKNLAPKKWKTQRKRMRRVQHQYDFEQSY